MLLNVITKKENLPWYFLVFAGLSIYYSQERLLGIDCSNFLFHIVNFKTFCFPGNRIGSLPSQLPLIVATYFKLPLKVLIPLYSFSFVLVHFLGFWICLKPLRNFPAAFAILLSLVMGMQASYFYPVTETNPAMVYTALLYAWVSHKSNINPLLKHAVIFLLITLCAFTHPVSFFTVGFVLAYYLISSGGLSKPIAYIPLVLTILIYLTRVAVSSGYDADQYNSLKNFTSSVPGFFDLPPIKYLIYYSKNIYLLPLLLFLYNNVMLIARKKFLLMLLHLFGVIGFTLITVLTFSHGDTIAIMEKRFLPAVFMIAFTFGMISFENREQNAGAVLTSHITILYGLLCILVTGNAFTARLDYFRSILAYQHTINQPKMIVTRENLDPTYLFNEWSMAIDIMMLSKLQGDPVPYTTFLMQNPDETNPFAADPDNYLHVPFFPYINIHELNRDYFNVPSGMYYQLPKNIRL